MADPQVYRVCVEHKIRLNLDGTCLQCRDASGQMYPLKNYLLEYDPVRNPKLDPRPGDELIGPTLKAKVTSILLGESGIVSVFYKVTTVAGHYDKHVCNASLSQWSRFVASERVTVSSQVSH